MRLLITGSVDYGDHDAIFTILNRIHHNAGGEVITLVLAEREGVGKLAEDIAVANEAVGFEWEPYSDGSLTSVDSVFAWFWDGQQTNALVDRARSLGIPVAIFADVLSH